MQLFKKVNIFLDQPPISISVSSMIVSSDLKTGLVRKGHIKKNPQAYLFKISLLVYMRKLVPINIGIDGSVFISAGEKNIRTKTIM